MKKQNAKSVATALLVLSMALGAGLAHAHGNETHSKKADASIFNDEHDFGKQGNPKKVTRTIKVDMTGMMRFGRNGGCSTRHAKQYGSRCIVALTPKSNLSPGPA